MSSDDLEQDGVEAAAETPKEKPKLALEVSVESPGACERHVTVTVPRDDIERYFKDAYDELMPKAEVPGFRPGRAPRKLVESRFKDQIAEKVKGSLLMDALGQVSDDQDFSAISEPELDFDAITIPDDGPMKFEFDLEVRPNFDSPQWRGLQLKRPTREYSEEDVTQYIQKLLARYGHQVDRDGPAQPGDSIHFDIVVSDNGEEIARDEDLRAKVVAKLSLSDTTIEDFDKLIVGAKKGETRSGKATISSGAENEAMRGKELEFNLTIRKVSYTELPTLNQSFLDDIGGFEDEDELREAVRSEMDRQLRYRQQQHLRHQITQTLTAHADWELPPALVKRQARRELERMVLELQSSGFGIDVIQAHANELRQNSLEATKTALKEHFIFERIAEDEDIQADDADYDAEIELLAENNDESPRRVRARLEKRGQMDALRNQIVERKVIELICAEAQITDTPLDDRPEDDTCAINFALSGKRDSGEIPEAKHGDEAEDLRTPADHS